jgi:NADH-quinone oxidoreductase subunit J
METAVFALFALLAVGSSLVVVAHRSPIYSTLSLVLALFSTAVLFVLLGAPFIATLQVLIYAGAILVLFLFVIMLLNVGRDEGLPGGHRAQLATAIAGALVFAGMLALLLRQGLGAGPHAPLTEQMVSLTALAGELFTGYLLPFEIVGLLLLVAVVAATVIARRPTPDELAAGAGAGELAAEADAAPAPSYAAWAPEADRAAGGATPESVRGGSAPPAAGGGRR